MNAKMRVRREGRDASAAVESELVDGRSETDPALDFAFHEVEFDLGWRVHDAPPLTGVWSPKCRRSNDVRCTSATIRLPSDAAPSSRLNDFALSVMARMRKLTPIALAHFFCEAEHCVRRFSVSLKSSNCRPSQRTSTHGRAIKLDLLLVQVRRAVLRSNRKACE